jgi:NADPH:quinone reductase-like Zn-dependent oxidoreductase
MSSDLGPGSQNPFLALITPLFGGKKVLMPFPRNGRQMVEYIKELVVAGKFKPIVDRTYPFSKISEAFAYVLTQQKTGNVVISLRENDSPIP